MTDQIEKFFNAYLTKGARSVYTEDIPKEMMASEVDEDEWYEWKLIPGTFTPEDYKRVATQFGVTLPESFIEWHKRYFFADCDCSIVRLPHSLPSQPLAEIITNLDWYIPEQLIPLGLIPFASEGNDTGPLVFDTRGSVETNDYPIRVYDHEYDGELDGLSEIIFSSFDKMLACLTHFLNETNTRKHFEVIPDFYAIDPDGAGAAGRPYWESWIVMGRANFEEFGY
ncbi:SMI1/KNR4 family protein [Sphingobacterium puteale]|uniref:SMI1/KNR4 family protein n=1 Tax=Sphingobacterium puteale TaxID=2420510 RepID=UPI003D95CC27